MSTHKNIDRICVVVIVLSLLLTVLFMNGERLGIRLVVDGDAESHSDSAYFTANDLDGSWDSAEATVITLTGSGASISGSGAYTSGGSVYIAQTGRYVISGTLTEGSLVVDAYSSSKVWLLLDGVTITRSDSACLIVEQADKVFLTLAEGSENSLTGGSAYSDEAEKDGIGGAVFARDDLTINGSGSLTVIGGYKHGIDANDDLVITGGTITVTGARDAIHVNDSFRTCCASLTLEGQDEAIDQDNAGGYLYIESGDLGLTSADDAIHAEGDVTIAGSSVVISAGDDGIHAGTSVTITEGTVLIKECYEGIEAPWIELDGGSVTIYPRDDGLNANGGTDAFGMMGGGMPGMGAFPANSTEAAAAEGTTDDESTTPTVLITGGTLTIINSTGNDADGVDSNGDLIITGGDVRVSLTNNGNNSALDYGSESGGVCSISGGTVIACGNYSMAEAFDTSSEQCSILYTVSAGAEAGTTVALEDENGNILLSWAVPCSFSSVNLSCPEMQLGENCLVAIGGDVEAIALDEISASYGDARSGGFGGPMNFGGMAPREGSEGGDSFDGPGMGGGPGGEMGEIPEPPEGLEGGRPEMGQPPDAPPEMGEAPEMPENFDVEAPEMGKFPDAPPEMGEMNGDPGDFEDNFDRDSAVKPSEFSTEEGDNGTGKHAWPLLGVSTLLLLLAIGFALKFKHS